MSSSLVPEKPLQISPSLAATIGLEEATMLSILDELMQHREAQHSNGYQWLSLDEATLNRYMPFWTDHDIQRISKNLRDKGILLLGSAPFRSSRELQFAFNEVAPNGNSGVINTQQVNGRTPTDVNATSTAMGIPIVDPGRPSSLGDTNARPHNRHSRGANLIAPNWQPSDDLMRQIAQHNVPEHFVHEQLPEFITYWSERREPHHSWGSKFLKQVLRKWREHQTEFSRRDQEVPMHKGWRPSPDALDILTRQAGINPQFIEDAIPEFVLYWQERGDISRAWNSKFIQHVRRQWTRFSSALEHDTEPKRIPEQWQPSEDVYDVLRLANIDINFAQQLLPEFILFWRDSNQVYTSWNTKFLQHVKYHWAKRHALTPVNHAQTGNSLTTQAPHDAGQQAAYQSSRTRDRSLVDDLTDRSWAS